MQLFLSKTQEGCGGLGRENPEAFPKARPIFQQPVSQGAAKRGCNKRGCPQAQANACKLAQFAMQTNADFRLPESTGKRAQMQTNLDKRKVEELHPFYAPPLGALKGTELR